MKIRQAYKVLSMHHREGRRVRGYTLSRAAGAALRYEGLR